MTNYDLKMTNYNLNCKTFSYDRDANNEPCLKSGQKAHWALLTGILDINYSRLSF